MPMKNLIMLVSTLFFQANLSAQTNSAINIVHKKIKTNLGEIAVQMRIVDDKPPILFLHGIYFDHHLWDYQIENLTNRSTITIDMPLHGASKSAIPKNWTLEDCSTMVIELLDALNLPKVIAIGHSWGAMTILRAAATHPERFQSIGFCNMPFKEATTKVKSKFRFQHMMVGLRKFYTKEVAKVMFGKDAPSKHPEWLDYLRTAMGKLTNKEVRWTDELAIINAKDASLKITALKVPAIALKGRADYVGNPPNLKLTVVDGGHVSPLVAPQEVLNFVHEVMLLSTETETPSL